MLDVFQPIGISSHNVTADWWCMSLFMTNWVWYNNKEQPVEEE